MSKPKITSKESNTNLHDQIVDRICRLADGLIRLSGKSIQKGWDIRHTDLRLLNTLDGEDSLSVNEISRRSLVDQAWVSRSLRSLEKKKMIKRRQDPTDSRKSLIALTAKGARTLEEIRPYAKTSEELLLKGINEKRFKEMMNKLEINLENMIEELDQFTDSQPRK